MSEQSDPLGGAPGAPGAPPRSNGELVFEAPWESRVFGLAVALHDAGIVDFETFRSRLIAEIGSWEDRHGPAGGGYRYYERWLSALEETVLSVGLVESPVLGRARATIERDWSHDH